MPNEPRVHECDWIAWRRCLAKRAASVIEAKRNNWQITLENREELLFNVLDRPRLHFRLYSD